MKMTKILALTAVSGATALTAEILSLGNMV